MNEKIGYRDILKQKEYMKMIVAALVNRFGDSIDAIASAWIVYELTSNAAWSAVIFGANRLPSVLVTPFAGAWVERKDKKKIMVVTDLIRAICVAFVATGCLCGFLRAWMLFVTTLIISTVEAFRGPANTALVPKILEKKYYEYGMSLMSTLSTIVELIGTAMAAGIIALIGSAGAIYIDMATFVLSALIIAAVNLGERDEEKNKSEDESYFTVLSQGISYVKRNSILIFLIGLCVFLNVILVPFNSLQAPLAEEILLGGAEILSILSVALTIGMLIGSVTYPVVRKAMRGKRLVFCGSLCIGIYYLGLIFCQPFYESKIFMYFFVAAASVLFGYFVSLIMSFVNVEVVKQVEESYMARVAAIVSAFGSAATPVASFLVATMAIWMKTEILFAAAGIIDVIGCIFMLRSKALAACDE